MVKSRMYRSVVPLLALFAALGAAFTVAPLSAAAASVTAQFGTVNGSSAFLINGTGFGNNETIKLTGATNDGRQALYPDTKSDGNGNFNAALYPEASVVNITATGQSSNTAATVSLRASVVVPGQPYPYPPNQPYQPYQPYYPGQPYPGQPYQPYQPYYPGQPYPGQPYPGQPYPGQPYPGQQGTASVGIGQQVNATGGGFRANEQISVWLTGPDASVIPASSVSADNQGGASATAAFPTPGLWQVTLYGQSSGLTVIDRFTVGGGGIGVPGPSYPGPSYPGPAYPGGGSVPPVPIYRSV